ncbi:hypothetical protein PCE31106_00360 [Pandoraea cepalis]|uniref:Uncharacterized protein n=1 Tax=Pandoraea cepalis TaxID=2508294 RepID=A0A5E4RSP1_9BURK|nr:hypothetical protein [Pandoraea cepalis]VVD66287.1 hypothetical protein PCE31106_00360 [Pandoraea cepalis]
MSPVSNQRVIRTTPRYDLPPAAQRAAASLDASKPFTVAFLGARRGRAAAYRWEPTPARRDDAVPPPISVWRTAVAAMLITRLAAPAVAALPPRAPTADAIGDGHRDTGSLAGHPVDSLPDASLMPGPAVDVRPLERPSIKSGYTLPEALRSVGAAREPFRNFAEAVADAYTLLSGHDIDPDIRRQIRTGTGAVDFATGLIPEVQVLRMPSELASVAADGLEGKRPDTESVSGLAQYADPRSFASHLRPHAPRDAPRPGHDTPANREDPSDSGRPESPSETAEAPHTREIDAADFVPASPPLENSDPVPATPLYIDGEAEHLHGYAQALAPEQLPPGPRPRLVLVNGDHYLGGDAGYYRASHGRSDDHWLIDAPRRDKAQVPVTFDAVTGQWQAHAPLRLCGGGCGSSKGRSPDSIAGRHSDIEQAISHLYEEKMQVAILQAMGELGDLHLMRTNRRDRHGHGDSSIVNHRRALRDAMKHIDRYAPLVTQQRKAAEVTARHYFWNHYGEAFCQENAEILFHRLLQNGVPEHRLCMITITPHRRSPHVLVLYTEAHDFITLLDLATPQPPVIDRRDGISGVTFGGFVYMNQRATLLLDPWSTTKVIEFSRAGNELDVIQTLDDAFEEIGHRSGEPYTVSVTRPFGTRIFGARQRSISSLGSAGSRNSLGSTLSGPGSEGALIVQPEVLNRPDAEPNGRRHSAPERHGDPSV